jgi:hypothetical protein
MTSLHRAAWWSALALAVPVAVSLSTCSVAYSLSRIHPQAGNANFVGTWTPNVGVGWTILTQAPDGACTGSSADSGFTLDACQVTGDNYVFTIQETSSSYYSNNSGTLNGDTLSGDFTDSNGTTEAYTATRAPILVSATTQAVDTYLDGSDEAAFTIRLSQASNDAVEVHYSTKDGSGPDAAKAAQGDYERAQGALTFAPGETTKVVDVRCFADVNVRTDENFDLVLSELNGAEFGPAIQALQEYGHLVNEDGPSSDTVRESIDPHLLVGRVGAIKNLTTGGVGTLYVKRFDTRRVVKLVEGDAVYVGDELFLDANSVSVVVFALGGAAAVQPGSHVRILDERHTYTQSGSRFIYLRQLLQVINNVSHQKETIQIQTNGGVIGIKG